MRKSQAGVEYIILTGILLVFLIPVINYALSESTLNVRLNQLENSLRRIAKAANTVYALGPGAQEIVIVTLPHGIEGTAIEDNGIFLNATLYGGVSEIHYATIPTVSGGIPKEAGTYRIRIITLENNTVQVGL